MRPLELDPWLTESGMVEAHHALRHAQEEERHLLTSSHQQLQGLEKQRVDLIKKIVTAFLTSYRWVACLSRATSDDAMHSQCSTAWVLIVLGY